MPGLDCLSEASNKARDYVRSYGKGAGVLGVCECQVSSTDGLAASGSLNNRIVVYLL